KPTNPTHPGLRALHGCAMMTLLKRCLLASALAFGPTVSAQTLTITTNFTIGAAVPDASPSGVASARTVSTPIAYVTGLKVALNLTGSFNGDLYCMLTHSSGHAVLLNRVGRRADSDLGYSDAGFNITFDDSATNGDVH